MPSLPPFAELLLRRCWAVAANIPASITPPSLPTLLLRSLHRRCRHHCAVATPSLHRCCAAAAPLMGRHCQHLRCHCPRCCAAAVLLLGHRCQHSCPRCCAVPANVAAAVAAPSLPPSLCRSYPVAAPLLCRRCTVASNVPANVAANIAAVIAARSLPPSLCHHCRCTIAAPSCQCCCSHPCTVADAITVPPLPPSLCRHNSCCCAAPAHLLGCCCSLSMSLPTLLLPLLYHRCPRCCTAAALLLGRHC